MYKPIKLVHYADGRNSYQFEKPPNLKGFDVGVYYYAISENTEANSTQIGIIYIPPPQKDITGQKELNDVFYVTDRTGSLPEYIFTDGSYTRPIRVLTREEFEREAQEFKNSLGSSEN